MDDGFSKCPFGGEIKGLGEGILKGDMNKVAKSTSLLAMYTLPSSAEPITSALKIDPKGISNAILVSQVAAMADSGSSMPGKG